MAENTGTAVFQDHVRRLETTDPKHPDTWNPNYQTLINNDVYLKQYADEVAAARGTADTIGDRIGGIEAAVGGISSASASSVQQAVSLDWLYRNNKVVFEMWKPGYYMHNTAEVALVAGVNGDDSIDIASTADITAGGWWVVDDTNGSILVQVAEVLSAQRIRITSNLPRTLTAGVLTKCSMPSTPTGVDAPVGSIWLSSMINVEDDASGAALIVRRTLNSGEARLYYRDDTHASWTEAHWSMRRQDGGIPAGMADYEYLVPCRNNTYLRIDIDGEDMSLLHIAALSDPTGLGGYLNPAMAPNAPAISSPTNGQTSVSATPTLAIAAYSSPAGAAQQSIQFQIATVNTFKTVLHDSGYKPAGLSYVVPGGVLPANTTCYLRARVQDVAGLWSAWSTVTSFTTMTSYVYITTPSLVSPANGAIDQPEQPTMTTGAFAVTGGSDTHAASQWQIRSAAGDWITPLWDSGDDTVNKTSRLVPAGVLQQGANTYYMRARHKGTTYGYSAWSAEISITTKLMFANIIGVCCTATGGDGGTWVHVDEAGATIATPSTAFFGTHPVFGGMQDVTLDSQAMVKVPKFYYKRSVIASGANSGKEAWWISDQPVSGFVIHPAFRNAGADIDQIYVGKYQASSDGTKLKSVSGVLPAVSKSLTTFQTEATARNTGGVTGFMLWSVFQWSAIQWLYLVENATMNSQTNTGMGRVSQSSAANVDAADVAQATYRGIVGLWGNVRQWVDGLKTDVDGHINLWDRNGNKTWVDTGRKRTAADGTIYPTTFMDGSGSGYDFDDVFIGDTGPTSNSNATAPDYQYFTTREYFPSVGGYWNYDLNAGLWYVSCDYDASNTSTKVGARLAKV